MRKSNDKKPHNVTFRNATKIATLCTIGTSFSSVLAAQNAPERMSTVVVESTRDKKGYAETETSMPMYSRPLSETPQVVSVIPKKLMQDQGITTTRDALRNVAGISIAAGEAGVQGDNLTIRGFTARSDFFMDGMRDFGSYTRDPFNMEKIDVIKGPSSVGFGRGSTGGIINQETKQARSEKITDMQLTVGTDMTKRAAVDINRKLDGIKGAAFRLNMMSHDNQVAERDIARNKRFGFAPTISFGLGSATRTTLSYMHQSENNIPDYGLPWIGNRVAGQSDTKRSSYYGFKDGSNYMNTTVDMLTGKVEHDISEKVTFRQQIRFANNQRDIRITEPKTTGLTPTTVTRNQIAANSTETMLDSQTSLQAKFDTGRVKHDLITGLELIRETSDPVRRTFTGVPPTSLVNPDPSQAFSGTGTISSNVHTTTETQAIFINDTLSPHEKFDIILGGRIDRFSVNYNNTVASTNGSTGTFTRTDIMPSVRSSFVYKPRKDASIYANYGTSYNPSAENFAFANGTQNVAPEKNETYEIGTKWGFFKNKLNTMFALFQTTKTNARTVDPGNVLLTVLGGNQRVKGGEFQINGEVTERFQVFAGYAYMQSEVISSTVANTVGNPLANSPAHTLNLWGTYKLTERFEFGGGVNAISKRAATITTYDANGNALTGASGSTPGYVKYVPGYVTFNMMARYQLTPKVSVQLNIYNLTNKFYYDQIHPSHVIPGAGRYALLTTNIKLD